MAKYICDGCNKTNNYHKKTWKVQCGCGVVKILSEAPMPGDSSGSAGLALLSAKDKSLNAMTELAEEFRVLGVYHYEEMVRGQQQAIRGAVITVKDALSRSI